jgi:hypothetical protein
MVFDYDLEGQRESSSSSTTASQLPCEQSSSHVKESTSSRDPLNDESQAETPPPHYTSQSKDHQRSMTIEATPFGEYLAMNDGGGNLSSISLPSYHTPPTSPRPSIDSPEARPLAKVLPLQLDLTASNSMTQPLTSVATAPATATNGSNEQSSINPAPRLEEPPESRSPPSTLATSYQVAKQHSCRHEVTSTYVVGCLVAFCGLAVGLKYWIFAYLPPCNNERSEFSTWLILGGFAFSQMFPCSLRTHDCTRGRGSRCFSSDVADFMMPICVGGLVLTVSNVLTRPEH